MRRKHFRRVLALVTALTVAIGLTVPAAYAASDFDSNDGKNSITVELNTNIPKSVRAKVKVNIYKVADAKIEKNGYVKYTKTKLFDPGFDPDVSDAEPDDNENYKENNGVGNVSLSSTKDKWPARAKTLAGYTVKEGFDKRKGFDDENYWELTTDDDGKTATKTGLKNGLYLITIDSITSGRTTYNFTPVLRCLPSLDKEGKEWDPNQTVTPKYDDPTSGGGGGNSTKSITVLKIWKDEGQESDRPDSVTVELLRDGEVYASQELSKSNNWRHTWTGLSKGNSWVVNEVGAPSDKYTVLTESEGNTFTVTNTHTTDIDDPDTPLDPGPGPGGDPGTNGDIPPTNIDDPDVPLDPGRTPGDNATNIKDPAAPANAAKLPQTGQLWWPVPILAVAGIAFFSIGWLRSRKDESEENR